MFFEDVFTGQLCGAMPGAWPNVSTVLQAAKLLSLTEEEFTRALELGETI
jgi:hypothetical protein